SLLLPGRAAQARAVTVTASSKAVGNQDGGEGSIQVKRRQRRYKGQAQAAESLGPKRYVARSGCSELTRRSCRATGVETRPHPLGYIGATWQPRCLPCLVHQAGEGQPLARGAHEAAGVGSGSKQMPSCNGRDRR